MQNHASLRRDLRILITPFRHVTKPDAPGLTRRRGRAEDGGIVSKQNAGGTRIP